MTAPARLLSVRLQGFKSFAERTHVEFGPGISAIVGPNGSGKSNLADALRWALGEQGRALRTRKAEDVIWAGSERRAAVGMADVQLILDNADGLLPIEYGVVELGRRLFRSGENEYLLNRARVRLRDLVDLLDAAHLAENAFLFIGQGMVDQALALRPEERRPLFEEVAGVRRHDRRRRRAEEQLVESEANLARVEDILAELRPQARRLAAQAEQQTTRDAAGEALADAVLLAAGLRWHAAAARVAAAAEGLATARRATDAAIVSLTEAEDAATLITMAMDERGQEARERRSRLDAASAALTTARLHDAGLAAELASLAHDRERIDAETGAIVGEQETQRRVLAGPPIGRSVDAERASAAADRAHAEAVAEVAVARASTSAGAEETAAIQRAAAAAAAELDAAQRLLADAQRRADEERARHADLEMRRQAAADAHERRAAVLAAATQLARDHETAAMAARLEADAADSDHGAAAGRLAETESALRVIRRTATDLRDRLAAESDGSLLAAAGRHGGRAVVDGLDVDPRHRSAVEAALGERLRGIELPAGAIADLGKARGTVVVAELVAAATAATTRAGGGEPGAAAEGALLAAVAELGGGRLDVAVRRDPSGAVRLLLRHVVWLPDLRSCLAIQVRLQPGWLAVSDDGVVVVEGLTVRLGAAAGLLSRQGEYARLELEAATSELEVRAARVEVERGEVRRGAAREARAAADEAARRALVDVRLADEAERQASRALEAALREVAWSAAQERRAVGELERATGTVASLEAVAKESPPAAAGTSRAAAPGADDAPEGAAIATWKARVAELGERRVQLGSIVAAADAARRADEMGRARAEAAVAIGEARLGRLAEESLRVTERRASIATDRERSETARQAAADAETQQRALLEAVLDADAVDRERLATLERDAALARGRLRAAEDSARSAERSELEARLGLEALRDGVLVDLAALGAVGLRHLRAIGIDGASLPELVDPQDDDEGAAAAFEAALAAASTSWAAAPPGGDIPTAGRLTALRRRFHELGAPNPYATEEYRALRDRLATLEAQDADLRAAIVRTRELIAELDALIAEQFRSTFSALEAAFDRRFRQLFGGGFARLSLTDPADLAATGVDIVARPPGKKAQALAMLSGGERALTAVALLFAMLEVRPVPFCVLDEVDAALDEANIGRFTSALRELADATQFIVITHNRGTIEMADALYGVTVGDDSVSRLISLRLDEARALADEDRAAAAGVTAGVG